MSQAVRTIRREHRDYSQVLECLCRLLDRLEEPGGNKRRRLLFLILDYVEAFPALRRRQPDYGPLLDRLHDEHAQALDLLAELRAACLAWRQDGVSLPALREDDPLFGAPRVAQFERLSASILTLASETLGARPDSGRLSLAETP
jgi:hypothetical protein